MSNHFATAPFVLIYSIRRLSNTFIYLCYLKRPQNLAALENYFIPRLRRDLGMIQQERQNNIINILGGHSYAM